MQIITLVNRKGGCGKSTLACLFALYWAEQGKRVAVRDMDPQGSSAAFVQHTDHPEIVEYDEGQEADLVIVDTLGGIRDRDVNALVDVSDLVLIPFLLSPTDMRATGETVRRIDAAEKTRLLFNRVNVSTGIFRDRNNYANIMGIKALKHYLCDRVSYKHALVDGWTALNKKAKDELMGVAKEIERGV